MKKIRKCPKCGSDQTYMCDHQSLLISSNTNKKEAIEFGWDNEVYADFMCDKCSHSFSLIGKITWPEAKIYMTDAIHIDKFMGLPYGDTNIEKVRTDWNELMKIVGRINLIKDEISCKPQFLFVIHPSRISVFDKKTQFTIVAAANSPNAHTIETVYLTVLKFIKWYNKKK